MQTTHNRYLVIALKGDMFCFNNLAQFPGDLMKCLLHVLTKDTAQQHLFQPCLYSSVNSSWFQWGWSKTLDFGPPPSFEGCSVSVSNATDLK